MTDYYQLYKKYKQKYKAQKGGKVFSRCNNCGKNMSDTHITSTAEEDVQQGVWNPAAGVEGKGGFVCRDCPEAGVNFYDDGIDDPGYWSE